MSSQDEPVKESTAILADEANLNPFLHFAISEAYAALAAGVVHVISRGVAYCVYLFDKSFPIPDAGPFQFFETIMSWGSAFATAATFLLITYYQLVILTKRLAKQVTR